MDGVTKWNAREGVWQMHAKKLKCWKCNWEGALAMKYECPVCGNSLEVVYDYEEVNKENLEKALSGCSGLWSFTELLPVRNPEHIISLNEGATPLYRSSEEFECQVYWKDETRNPTLSFKDRPNSVGISVAKEFGFQNVSIASTGNGGASLSAYAAKGKMQCHICIPEYTPQGKVVQAEYHGAELVVCKGDYSDSYQYNKQQSEKNKWANMTSTYLNPYTMEGDKTIAYELFIQLGRKVPEWVVVPLGAGAMLTGIYKGFVELKKLGFCSELPKMIGVQAEGCAPIVDAWLNKQDEVQHWDKCRTIAGAIADPLKGYEKDGTRTLHCIYESKGAAVKVSDKEIMYWVKQLAERDGLFVEPASASAAAAIAQLLKERVIKEDETAIGIITAHGLKDSEELEKYIEHAREDG